MKRKISLLLIVITTIFLNFSSVSAKSSINVRIDQPISDDFPKMEVYTSVTDKNQDPMLSLIRGNFSVLIDGEEVTSKVDVAGFQYTDEGVSYSLVMAANGMMEGEPFDQQLKAAIRLMEALREQDTLSIYTFGEDIKPVFEYEKKDEKLLEKINSIKVLGGNPHLYDALVLAARRAEKSDLKRRVVIVMSDGRENGSMYKREDLFKIIDTINIPVYSIGLKLMAGQNIHRIARISKHTGGAYLYSAELADAPDLMEKVTRQVVLGYKLTFTVDNIEPDDQLHQLNVKVISKGQEGTFFKNFKANIVPMPLWLVILLIVFGVLFLVGIIILIIYYRRKQREAMGITKRKCPDCGARMKDDWDECMFCKYEPPEEKRFLFFFKKKKK